MIFRSSTQFQTTIGNVGLPSTSAQASAPDKDLKPQKSVMTCPLCSNTAIEIVSRCATCKICGWSVCGA